MAGLLDDYLSQLMMQNNGSTGFLDPALATMAQGSMQPSLLGQSQPQAQPQPQAQGGDWSSLGPLLLSLGAGIASGSGKGWGAGIGAGLGLAQEQMRLRQNDDFKKLALALQMQESQATQDYRNAQLGNQAKRTELYEQAIKKPRPRSFAVNPNTGAYYDTTTAAEVGGGEPSNPYFGGKMTDTQAAAGAYVDRMAGAHKIITDYENINKTDSTVSTAAATLGLNEKFGNVLQSKERQQVVQAQRNFINAVLRKESGAVISPEEFNNAKLQYFPQVGDAPEVIAQKRQNRLAAMQGMARGGGPNYAPPNFANPPVESHSGDRVPDGVDPNLWAIMTDEEKSAWK
jgi:hypothetical protein